MHDSYPDLLIAPSHDAPVGQKLHLTYSIMSSPLFHLKSDTTYLLSSRLSFKAAVPFLFPNPVLSLLAQAGTRPFITTVFPTVKTVSESYLATG